MFIYGNIDILPQNATQAKVNKKIEAAKGKLGKPERKVLRKKAYIAVTKLIKEGKI